MNFQDIYKKIRAIEEGSAPVEECGEMGVISTGAMQPPKQPDSVSMNVSMNASGTEGIRDLMSVLHSIEQGGGDEFAGALETDTDGSDGESLASIDSQDLAIDSQPGGDQMLGDKGVEEITGDVANAPDPAYQSQDYMHDTLSGNAQPQHKHGYRNGDNPLGFKEGLESSLANLYQEIKERN